MEKKHLIHSSKLSKPTYTCTAHRKVQGTRLVSSIIPTKQGLHTVVSKSSRLLHNHASQHALNGTEMSICTSHAGPLPFDYSPTHDGMDGFPRFLASFVPVVYIMYTLSSSRE